VEAFQLLRRSGLVDGTSAIYCRFPLMLSLIALVTFVLLARGFRSILLPAKAMLLNLVSLGAAYGMPVLVWQQGHGSSAIWGIPATGSITIWIPLMVFAFLFGLSMDYEVFILARMREEYDRTDPVPGLRLAGERAGHRAQDPRHRARRRHPARRHRGPRAAGAGACEPVRPLELVAAALGRPPSAGGAVPLRREDQGGCRRRRNRRWGPRRAETGGPIPGHRLGAGTRSLRPAVREDHHGHPHR
jgi:hypothetical protein